MIKQILFPFDFSAQGLQATEHAREEDADLILIARGSLQAPQGRLRTHAYGIIQRSRCPVLSA